MVTVVNPNASIRYLNLFVKKDLPDAVGPEMAIRNEFIISILNKLFLRWYVYCVNYFFSKRQYLDWWDIPLINGRFRSIRVCWETTKSIT